MRNPLKSDTSHGLGMLAARIPMGVFFLVLGYGKFHGGVDSFVSTYIGHVPANVPHEWGMHYLQAIPYAEMAVGTLLILGFLTRLAGFVGAAMVVTFMVGVTGWRMAPLPFHPNIIYIGLLLAIFLVGPGKMSLDAMLFKRRSAPAPVEE